MYEHEIAFDAIRYYGRHIGGWRPQVARPGGGGGVKLQLYCSFTAALLQVADLTVELPGGEGVVKALLLLYCCFTAALLLVDLAVELPGGGGAVKGARHRLAGRVDKMEDGLEHFMAQIFEL
jgi:hypothetical protein